MSKPLVLGAAALALSAGTASAQGYGYGYGYGYDNSYAAPVADLAAPDYGYGYGYAAPAYAAPATAGTTVIIVTPGSAPAYTAPPVASGYYAAGVVSQPIYNLRTRLLGGSRILAPMVVVDRRIERSESTK